MSDRDGMRLTADAQKDRDAFEAKFGASGNCSCHLHPPCGSCTHPGNPDNQAEDDTAWEPDPYFAEVDEAPVATSLTLVERERILAAIAAAMDEPNPPDYEANMRIAFDAAKDGVDEFALLQVGSLFKAALFCDDLKVDHPQLDDACIRRIAADALIRSALLIIRSARKIEGTEFNPGRVAFVVFQIATAVEAHVDTKKDELKIFEPMPPGQLRAEFEKQGLCKPREATQQTEVSQS